MSGNQKNKLAIIGCGGHAKSIADVALNNNPNIEIIFLDESAKIDEKIIHFPVYRNYNIKNFNVILGIGNNDLRKIISNKYNSLVNVISNKSYVGRGVKLGKGIFIAHCSHIGILSQINNNVIINTNASIDHEVFIDDFSQIAPNATICGKVYIGKNVFIGAGSIIKERVSICDNVIIGAGSVVIKDIKEAGTYVGNILRRIK